MKTPRIKTDHVLLHQIVPVRLVLLCALAWGLTLLPQSQAAVRFWSGDSLTSSAWSAAANWSNNVVPVAGDDLVFPVGLGRPHNSNDMRASPGCDPARWRWPSR